MSSRRRSLSSLLVFSAVSLTVLSLNAPAALAYHNVEHTALILACEQAKKLAPVGSGGTPIDCVASTKGTDAHPPVKFSTDGVTPIGDGALAPDDEGDTPVQVTFPPCTAGGTHLVGTVTAVSGGASAQQTLTLECTPAKVTVLALTPQCAYSQALPAQEGRSRGEEQVCSFRADPPGAYNVTYALTPTNGAKTPYIFHGDAVSDAQGNFAATVDSFNRDAYTLTGTVTDNTNIIGSHAIQKSTTAPSVYLGRASGYSVLATTVTDNGETFISGSLGSATGPVTGLTNPHLFGSLHVDDDPAAQAHRAAGEAIDDGFAMTPTGSFSGDLNGRTFTPGVYATAAAFGLTGTMYLDGQGNPDADFVFQVNGALATGAGSRIALINGAQAARVFFVSVGAATPGADSVFQGSILARGAITVGAGATVNGAVMSLDAITLATNDINGSSSYDPAGRGAVDLKSASDYAVLSNTAITDNGDSFIGGNVGLRPTGTVTGVLHPQVSGLIQQAALPSTQARADFTHAYSAIRAMVPHDTFAGDQNGKTFTAGVHAVNAAFSLTGTMFLDAQGDPNANFVFQIAGALGTGASSRIALINGAQASHVFFEVIGAANPGADSLFQGTILSSGAITVGAGSTVNGAVFSKTAITLATNDINRNSGSNAKWGPNWRLDLGTAAAYSALCTTGVTDNGQSRFGHDVGVGVGHIVTGLDASQVGGDMHIGDGLVTKAREDFTHADSALRALAPTDTFAGDSIGKTFTAGVHATGAAFSLTGLMFLDAQGDPNANFVFQITGALGMAAGAEMVLTNGAQASHVFFQVTGDAGSGAGAKLVGTILTSGAITLGINSTLNGAIMSKTAITTATNTVSMH